MKVTVEIVKYAYPVSVMNPVTGQRERSPDDDMIQTKVLIDGKRDLHMERIWTRDEFHSYFDKIWCYMGQQIKKMNFDLEFNDGH